MNNFLKISFAEFAVICSESLREITFAKSFAKTLSLSKGKFISLNSRNNSPVIHLLAFLGVTSYLIISSK